MFNGQYTYLWLNVLTIFFPFILSFDKKVAFYTKWKYLIPSTIITGAVFIIWDIWFTKIGVWGFNPSFLTGIYFANLPLEEWLFFITIPYSCVFIYECLKCWFSLRMSNKTASYISYISASILITSAIFFREKAYTSITFSLLAFFLILQELLFKSYILKNFIPAYAISVVPFLLVNGVLTANPVVIYNDAENLGFRLYTIPFEDIWYGMLLVLMNITFIEIFRTKIFVNKKANQFQ